MARRFVCTQDGSNKFWEGSCTGNTLTTHWGRMGTAGQSKDKIFDTPQAAQKELDKLIREKTGSGYIEEGTGQKPATPAAIPEAAAPPPTEKPKAAPAPPGTPLGKYTQALIAMVESKPRRSAPHTGFSAWAAAETRPDLRALFTAMAQHDFKYAGVDEFNLASDVGRVPSPNDGPDRTDVIWVGSSGGGDGYIVAAPGTSQDDQINLVIHDENWSDGGQWTDLEDLLGEQVEAERASQREEGVAAKDVSIELEAYIRKAGDDAESPVEGGVLALVKGTGRRRDVRDVRQHWGGKPAPSEFTNFFYAETRWDYDDVGYQDFYWHGRYAFASIAAPVEGAPKRVAKAVLYDRGGPKPTWLPIEPPLFRTFGTADYESSMPFSFTEDGSRLLVSGSRTIAWVEKAFVEGGGTPVLVVDLPSDAGALVCEGKDDIAGVGWVGALAGVFRRGKKGNELELYEAASPSGWRLLRAIPCAKLDHIIPFGGGRAAVITKKRPGKARSAIVGFRGNDVRLLGIIPSAVFQAYTLPEGSTVISTDSGDNKWSQLKHLDEALDATFAGPTTELLLAGP